MYRNIWTTAKHEECDNGKLGVESVQGRRKKDGE